MLNVALVGTWHVHFKGYAGRIAERDDCKITCLWDPDAAEGKKQAEAFSCDYEPDYDKMLARDDVDAVLVCTSTDLHYDVMSRAALAGKHIFTEKVLCITYADAEKLRDIVKKSGIKFCISFPWRSRGDFLWVKSAIDSGLIGDVNYCRIRNAHNGASSGWLPDTFYEKKTCGGGAMMDLGAHSMYLLNWFFGEPEKAASAFTNVKVQSVEDNAVTLLTYAGGTIGVSETAFVAENNPFELELVGSRGTILGGGVFGKTSYNIGEGWVFPNTCKNLQEPIDMWVDACVNGGEIPYGIDDAAALTKTMELAYGNMM